jgi:hypothetical protein
MLSTTALANIITVSMLLPAVVFAAWASWCLLRRDK